ncbi:MAG: gluconate permease [Acetilactobacillus jinshanensis]
MGKTLLLGIIVAIPCAIIAGPLFSKLARKYIPDAFVVKHSLPAIGKMHHFKLSETPKFGISALTSLFPVIFMAIATVYQIVFNGGKAPKDPHGLDAIFTALGNPILVMVISLLFAIWSMGFHRGKTMADISQTIKKAVDSIAMLLFIIGGGAAFKQVLIDGGVGTAIQHLVMHANLSPLILGWLIAVILRVSLGSAMVSGMTAAGLVTPIMHASNVDPVLMVLAIGAGSLAASHVNDTGFWMFQEYFDLTVGETLKTWTVLETVISIVGLLMVLLLNAIVG